MPDTGDRPRPSPGPAARQPLPPARRRPGPTLIIGVVVVLVATLAAVLLATRDDGDDDGVPVGATRGTVAITSFDGVRLSAAVTRPGGRGRHPLVVMPASFNANAGQYAALATVLGDAGYVTVSYTQRGFQDSGGSVDLAGSDTQRDARRVIDWALQNTPTDPKRIGMLGVSYGAGISLLTAAQDPRVRAVVALSTWTDLAEAFYPNGTLSIFGGSQLLSDGRADAEMATLRAALQSDPVGNASRFVRYLRPRSPANFVGGLNRNRTAVMIANGWQDSLFPPTMLVDFFGKLTTPKRLQLSTGDHVGPERTLLAGQRSTLGDDALAWLAHYLGGTSNGIEKRPPVALQDVATGTVHGYPSWPDVSPTTLPLGPPSTSAVALGGPAPTWQASVTTGRDSDARAGASQFVASKDYKIPTIAVGALPADRALVWGAEAAKRATRIVGTPRLSLSIACPSPIAALFVYLYDTAPNATGTLMTSTPLTVRDAASAKRVSVDLEPISWTLKPGHRLAVVIDTVEPRWLQPAPAGTSITVSSDAGDPAELRVPTS